MNKNRIIKAVFMNWTSLVVTAVASFFLSPFVVHHLGNVAYGVWVLVNSIVGYVKLTDLGMRGAVVRYVSKGHAQGDHQEASSAVSAALWFRIRISLGVLVVAVPFAFAFPHFFKIPGELTRDAQIALVFAALTTVTTLVLSIFGSVLAAMPRFDLISLVEIGQTVLRVVGVVYLLRHGHGIVAMAGWELLCGFAGDGTLLLLAKREYPQLRVSWSKPAREILGKVWNYSLWIFVLNTALQIAFFSDNLVVAAFVSTGMVTFYAIGGNLMRYADQVVASLGMTVSPVASRLEASGDTRRVRALLIRGTQGTLLASLPILITLYIRGGSFIGLWMGPSYKQISGMVLQILVLCRFFAFANVAGCGIMLGTEKQKPMAVAGMAEALANLALSLALVRSFGVFGVAWGTTIPALLVQGVFWPWYICRVTEVPLREHLSLSWGKPLLAVVPFAAATYLIEIKWPAANLFEFGVQTFGLCVLFVACAGLVFHDAVRFEWQRRFKTAGAAGAK